MPTPTMNVNTEKEARIIVKIAQRAKALGQKIDAPLHFFTVLCDVTACHANGNPLRLEALLESDDFNFIHDVYGIARHIDRTTGQLLDCFRPRFSSPS